MDVSIIIVNYHTEDLVIDCVDSINRFTEGVSYEIIVVDNASGDDAISKLQSSLGDRIRLIPSSENLGFGKGNNLGAEAAIGKYLFLLNPDTYFLNNAVKLLEDYLEDHPETGLAGGNLFFPDETPAPSFCLDFDTPKLEKRQASWGQILTKRAKQKAGLAKELPYADAFNYSQAATPVAYIFGADMMIRREVFEELHGFDPEFFMYAEEEELSWRVHKLGYKIVNVPEAKIVHLEGAATGANGGFNARQFRMRMNGKLIYYRKCFGLEGMEQFYKHRRLQYQRIMKLAKLRGKDPKRTNAFRMLEGLDEEYKKYKAALAAEV